MPKQLSTRTPFRTTLVLSTLLLVASCALYPKDTMTLTYAHFVPRQGSLFKLEFDYPATWDFGGDRQDDSFGIIGASEFPEPTLEPRTYRAPNAENGVVLLSVERIDPASFSVDDKVKPFLETTKNISAMMILSEHEIMIDGYPARHITTRVAPRPSLYQWITIIDETVFLKVEDRFYWISLEIPESRRSGPFAKGFDYLVASIRIIR